MPTGVYKRVNKRSWKLSQTTKKKMSLAKTGELNSQWKGDNAGKVAIHTWVKHRLGRPSKCEECGEDGLTGVKINWANINHLYRRVLSDWKRLCTSCHGKYDKINKLRIRKV